MTAYVKRASVPPHLVDDRDPPAIALLKEDHQILRVLFDLVETTDDDVLFPIAGDICIRLAIHLAVEEHLLYPALKPVIGRQRNRRGNRRAPGNQASHFRHHGHDGPRRGFSGQRSTFLARKPSTISMRKTALLFRHARKAWEEGKIDLVELGTEMSRHRRDLFDLVGSVAADTQTIDLEPSVRRSRSSRNRVGGMASRLV